MKTCLLVEDSRLARKEFHHLLTEIGAFEVIEEAENAEDAIRLLSENQIDVLFLDIHLPGMNGFELLERLDYVPQVIFTTAYDEYAIKSFDYNAIDYLLKPIRKERLQKALAKLDIPKRPVKQADILKKQVFVRDGEHCWFVELKDIRFFESMGNYSRVHFNDNKPLIHKSLSYLESVLDDQMFFRVNRKQIINLHFIEKLDTWFNGTLKIKLKSGEEIEVSRRQASRIKQLFSF